MTSTLRVAAMALLAAAPGCKLEHAKGITASDAPKQEKAGIISIADGRILTDMPGVYDRACPGTVTPLSKGQTGCVEHHFYVYPVVPVSWKPGDNVPAWITCAGPHKTLATCEAEVKAYTGVLGGSVAVRVGDESRTGRTTSGWESAIKDASARHGLTATPRGPVMRLGAW